MTMLKKQDILEFISNWYEMMDTHAPLEKVLKSIDPVRFEMQIIDGPMILGEKGFRQWYQEKLSTSFDSKHTIKSVDIVLAENGADIVVMADWEGRNWIVPGVKSEAVGFADKLLMHVRDAGNGQLVFDKYLVRSAE